MYQNSHKCQRPVIQAHNVHRSLPSECASRLACCKAQDERKAKRAFDKLAGKIEPGMMAKHFMRPEDNLIRTTDIPEREQLYRGPDPSNMDYSAMAL